MILLLALSVFCLIVALLGCRHCRVKPSTLGKLPPMLNKQAK